MPTKHFALRLAAFYGALFLIYGIHLPYFPVWLKWRGLTPEQISLIIAAPFFLRLAVTPALAMWADRTRGHHRFVQRLAALSLIVILVLTQLSSFWPIAIAATVFAISVTSMMPLTETIAVGGVRDSGLDYGRMRLWGSATFIAASFIGGAVLEQYGNGSGIWLILAGCIATFMAAALLPPFQSSTGKASFTPRTTPQTLEVPAPTKPSPKHASATGAPTSATKLLRSPLFLLFLVATGLAQASHATYYAFGTLQWLEEGISPLWIGVLWALGVITEIALFAYSRAVATKVGATPLIIAGALAALIRWLVMAYAPPLWALFPLQALHGLTYGATHLGAIHFLARAIPSDTAGTAQAYYSTISAGVTMGIATLLTGSLYATLGAHTYFVMAAFAVCGLIAAILMALTWSGGIIITSENKDIPHA